MPETAAALRLDHEFLATINIQRVVIGVSGGIDSAVVAALFAWILPPENLLLVNMPSRYNSALTKNAAADLAKNLACLYCSLNIEESVTMTERQVSPLIVQSFDGKLKQKIELSPFHLENVQARDRSSRLLSALASLLGEFFLQF